MKIDILSPENRNMDPGRPHMERYGAATTMFVVTATAFLTHLNPEANVWRHEREEEAREWMP